MKSSSPVDLIEAFGFSYEILLLAASSSLEPKVMGKWWGILLPPLPKQNAPTRPR